MSLKIKSISSEICGEGRFTGYPTTVVSVASIGGKKQSLENVVINIGRLRNNHICITGKEPLRQGDSLALVYELLEKNLNVNIHSKCRSYVSDLRTSRRFFYTIEVSTPSSGFEEKNDYSILTNLISKDEVKFTINDIEDYMFMKRIVKENPTRAEIIAKPKTSKITRELSNWLIEDSIKGARLGMPIHKLL